MRIGVLALQGGFAPHVAALRALGHEAVALRQADDLDGVEGLVLPGGESSAQLRALDTEPGLLRGLDELLREGAPLLATCAGLIVAAQRVEPDQPCFAWLPVEVRRNAYGRQLDSFEGVADDGVTPVVMIRAPRISRASCEVVATLREEPILVRDGSRFGATFHPELTQSLSIHRLVFGDTSHDSGADRDEWAQN